MMRTILMVLMLCGSVGKTIPPQPVDRIEVNTHVVDDKPLYRQLIFWHWHHDLGEYHARGYVLLDDSGVNEPVLSNGRWYVRYRGDDNKEYRACSKVLVFTETDYDPERQDKQRLPEEMRKFMAGFAEVRRGIINEPVER